MVSSIAALFCFQEGGRIPDLASFRNDGAITKVDGGEQIFSKDLSGRLESFLNESSGNGSSKSLTINLTIGERELSSVLVDLNQKGFRVA